MKIERYIAHDTKTAMARVRADLGPDALILANRRMGDRIEITAALNIDDWVDQQPGARHTVPAAPSMAAAPLIAAAPLSAAPAAVAPTNEIQLKALERELHRLRGMLEGELGERQWRDTAGMQAPLSALRQRLLRLGLSRTLSAELMRGLDQQAVGQKLESAWHHVLQVLATRIEVCRKSAAVSEDGQNGAIAVFGTTGVGKTSTIAKLAARDVQQLGVDAVGLISLDSYRLGAQEQLASFGDALGIPIRRANDRHELSFALRELQGRRVYIDTAGMGQNDPRLTQQLDLVHGLRHPITKLLVLSAAAQPAQSRAVSALFDRSAVSGAIITKIDEAQSLGGVLDVIIRAGLPAHSICDGQRVPQDIHSPDALGLVQRAIEIQGRDSSRSEQSVANVTRLTRASA
ncbi:MAG: flagellar biosynthesis protein FlhF [Congregibacter sp.]